MINFDEALKIAKELKSTIDSCDEYDKGYMFKAEADKWSIGGEGACCILKDSGRAVCLTEFYDKYNPVFIREIAV